VREAEREGGREEKGCTPNSKRMPSEHLRTKQCLKMDWSSGEVEYPKTSTTESIGSVPVGEQ
jgi:hypothetical protein